MTSQSNIKSFYKGQLILKEGQESNVAYMIRKGTVNIYKILNGKKVIFDQLGEGEIFGEMGVILGGTRTANVEASEFCELLVLTNSVIYGLLQQCPKTIQYMTKLLIRRLKRATSMVPDRDFQSSFLSICNIMDLLYKNHLGLSPEERKALPHWDMGINYARMSRRIQDIILVTQLDIDTVLKKLHSFKLLEVATLKSKRAAFPERFIRIIDPKGFMDVVANVNKEIRKTEFQLTTELEYIDLYEFADDVKTKPEILYKKLAAGEIPETLFFLHKSRAADWAEKQGPDFFTKAKKKRKKIEELDDVDDVIYVDNATLKEAFERLGYYKLGVLVAVAGDEARDKIMRNLARKMASIVQEEANGKEYIDETESEDVQEELIDIIRDIKGVD